MVLYSKVEASYPAIRQHGLELSPEETYVDLIEGVRGDTQEESLAWEIWTTSIASRYCASQTQSIPDQGEDMIEVFQDPVGSLYYYVQEGYGLSTYIRTCIGQILIQASYLFCTGQLWVAHIRPVQVTTGLTCNLCDVIVFDEKTKQQAYS